MDKIFERLLIEFLIPALLMFLCILLVIDVVTGSSFDLIKEFNQKRLMNSSIFLIGGILLSYIINTSISSLFNLVSRILVWGKIREYLMYRKLDIFKMKSLKDKKIWWLSYLCHRKEILIEIEKIKAKRKISLYHILISKLNEKKIPAQSQKSILDIYDVVRTIVMASCDSAIIGWIQYHWAHLRLARSTLVPAFLLIIFLPLAIIDWNVNSTSIEIMTLILCLSFFLIQVCHYYYRERFMIYAMLGYFLIC